MTLALLALTGCLVTGRTKERGDDDLDGDSGDFAPDTGDSAAPPPWWDCAALPELATADVNMEGPRGYHGLTFDDEGNIIGWDGLGALIKASYSGDQQVFVPGMTYVEGMDRLPDGDFVVSDAGMARLIRVSPEGGVETLSSGIAPYGVTVGPDGKVYAVDGRVVRVDPETGEQEVLIEASRRYFWHVANFNLDSTVMYLSTTNTNIIFQVELDEGLNPVGEPEPYVEGIGTGWHDAIGVDACGNLYIPDYTSAGLYRVSPEGEVVSLVEKRPRHYGHGAVWGSGIGGWKEDTLYLPQPYNGATVREVTIGVPSGDVVRTWKGEPAPW